MPIPSLDPSVVAAWDAQRDRLAASDTAKKHSKERAFRHEVCRALQVGTGASNDRLMAALDAAVASTQEEPMGTKLTINAEVRRKLGLAENATSEEVMQALTTALAKPTRAQRAAAAPSTAKSEADEIYEAVWPTPKAGPVDATEGLTPDEAAIYRSLYPTDAIGPDGSGSGPVAASDADALYRELWGDEG